MVEYTEVYVKFKNGEGVTLYVAKAKYESFGNILKDYFGDKYEEILHYTHRGAMLKLLITDSFVRERTIESLTKERWKSN